MVEIVEKSRCTGCSACAAACPCNAISLQAGAMGALYPAIDPSRCIDCARCQRVCPALNPAPEQRPQEVWAAKNPDLEVRLKSSSGGLFTPLAEAVIRRGGVVCGAAYDGDFEVEHRLVERLEELPLLRSSKYQQSRMGNCFPKIEQLLKAGREVLFSGTPCQSAGLKRYLQRDYEGLLTVDIVCHGAPVPAVWPAYLKMINPSGLAITRVDMRNKRSGWNRNRLRIESEEGLLLDERASHNLYLQGFLKDLYLRPSCHRCPAKGCGGLSDITLGDYWGINHHHPTFADPKRGVSLVLIHTAKGKAAFEAISAERIPSTWEQAIERNPALVTSPHEPEAAKEFCRRFEEEGAESAFQLLGANCRSHPAKRLFEKLKHLLGI